MKKVYWRPRTVSRTALVLIAGFSVVGLLVVEKKPVESDRPHHEEKRTASQLAENAMTQVYYARAQIEPEIDPYTDPTESGLIGLAMSPVTSISGDLTAKQTSANPNFAAVIVEMLKRANVGQGDVVAVACSGSFPALNICTYAALETIQAKPVVISSAAASQWGANVPELLWIDMEKILQEKGIFSTRSVATSIGGYEDRGLGLSDEGLKMVDDAIKRSGLNVINAETFEQNIEQRIQLYKDHASGKPIKLYINIGGGTVSVGRTLGKKLFHPGLNRRPPGRIQELDGVMPRLINEGIPIIHLVRIAELAERYGLPVAPTSQSEISVGSGGIFRGSDYSKLLATAVLVIVLLMLYGFIRSDIGFRLLRVARSRPESAHPEPMV
jgi:poly-gamma-glutamate system protein